MFHQPTTDVADWRDLDPAQRRDVAHTLRDRGEVLPSHIAKYACDTPNPDMALLIASRARRCVPGSQMEGAYMELSKMASVAAPEDVHKTLWLLDMAAGVTPQDYTSARVIDPCLTVWAAPPPVKEAADVTAVRNLLGSSRGRAAVAAAFGEGMTTKLAGDPVNGMKLLNPQSARLIRAMAGA